MTSRQAALRRAAVLVAARVLAIYAVIAGALSFSGWVFDLRRLADWDNDGIAIQPNTALAAISAGVALLALLSQAPRWSGACAWLTAFIGGVSLIENLFAVSLGIDHIFLFGRDWGTRGTTAPGRMGLPASLCLFLIGSSVLAISRSQRGRRLAAGAAIAVILVSVFSLMGYLFGASLLYSLPALTAISLQTSTIVFALGVGILCAMPDGPPLSGMLDDSISASLARRAVPIVLIWPVVLGLVRQAGERAQLYDTAMGIAISTLALTVLTIAVLVWGVATVAGRERELANLSQLRERAENRFRLATEALNGLVYEYDLLTRLVVPIRGLSEVLGFAPDQVPLTGDWWRERIAPEDLPRIGDSIARARDGELLLTEYRVRHADGRWLYLEDRGLIQRDDQGRPLRLIGCAIDITGRKAQEDALRERETLLSLAVEAADLGIFEWTPGKDEAIWHNERIYEFFGRERSLGPINGSEFQSTVCHPDDYPEWERRLAEAIAGGRLAFTGRIRRPDGEVRWIDLAGRFTADGPLPRLLGTVRDVTTQKERELRDRFLRLLDDALRPLEAPDEITREAAIRLGEHLGADRCAYAEIEPGEAFRVPADYCVGVPSLVGRYPLSGFGEAFRSAMLTGTVFAIEDSEIDERCRDRVEAYRAAGIRSAACIALHKSGKLVAGWAVHQKVPRRWTSEEIELIKAVADRTWESIERARILRDLAENEQRLRLSQEAGRIGSFEWMIPENRVIWSAELEHLYGLAAGAFGGTFVDWTKRVVPDDAEQVVSGVKEALARKEERFDYEFRAILPDGANRWLRGQAQFLYADDGTPLRMRGVNIDVDEQKRTTEALRAEDRRKTQFLATLAHELRNPLAPIRTGLELLKLSNDAPAERDEVVETIGRQVQQMVRLIDDLLDVSRITQGKIRLRREHCDLRSVLTAALDTSRPNLEANGVELTVVIPAEPIPLDADLTRLAQVFSNLLNNAAKYTPRGGSARLSAEISGGRVTVRVRDSGIGIPRDMLEHVFEMFTQVDESIERSHGGLGIGLSLVRALVEMHGGTVTAASDGPGGGSEFTVNLDLAGATEDARVPTLNGADVGTAGGLRIVLVDDNVDAAQMLSRVLGLKGHAVTTVHQGARAYDVIKEVRPDLVLLDLGMPEVSGFDVAARIRESEWGQTVFLSALTGWGQAEDRQRTADAGFNDHLVKPVDPDLLAEVIRRARASRPV